MILPCEIGVKKVVPKIKAMMAKSIIENHGLNEQQTANLLGLSQSAVSRYVSKERGNLLTIENQADILELIEQMVVSLIKDPSNKEQTLGLFCQICSAIRQKGLMCPYCQKEMPEEWAEACHFCR